MSQAFAEAYKTMDLPRLVLDYTENLSNIQSKKAVLKQEKIFNELETSLNQINTLGLSENEMLDFYLMKYEIALNKFRISLEKRWNEEKPDSISNNCIADVPNGPMLYTYFLKKWIDVTVTPELMYDFGLEEIQRVKKNMKNIQVASGMDSLSFRKHLENPDFFYNDPKAILKAYEDKKKRSG